MHQLDLPDDVCMHCGDSFCARCMVYPRGDRKPGVCKRCALALAGVRHAKTESIGKREFRKRRTALMDELSQRPRTFQEAMDDLSWLDQVEYGAEAGGRGRRVSADTP